MEPIFPLPRDDLIVIPFSFPSKHSETPEESMLSQDFHTPYFSLISSTSTSSTARLYLHISFQGNALLLVCRLLHPYAISKNRQAAISPLEVALSNQ